MAFLFPENAVNRLAGKTSHRILLSIIAFLLGMVATLLVLREPTEPLTIVLLRSARQRWAGAHVNDYSMRYRMHANEYAVLVRDEIAVDVSVDGRKPTSMDWSVYSVEGLFDTLEQELENLGESSSTVKMRARFNQEFGYLERYLRGSPGLGRPVVIETLEFIPHHSAAR